MARSADHGLPFSAWSLSKLAVYLIAQRVVGDIPTRGCACYCASRVSPCQAVRIWKTSADPDYEAKKNRVPAVVRDRRQASRARPGDPTVVNCMDELVDLVVDSEVDPLGVSGATGEREGLPACRRVRVAGSKPASASSATHCS
jgi:hypothetical protein